MRPLRRGQATVELALGATVLVVTLLVGIHLAEVAALSLKVQEASTYAAWEAATRRVQTRELNGDTTDEPFRRTLDATSGVAAEARRRYQDFNGLSSAQGPAVIAQALTEGSQLSVECHRTSAVSFAPTGGVASLDLDEGGLACSSRATLTAVRIPHGFLQEDDGAFFREDPARTEPMTICGMGRAHQGQCEGSLALLTNDWGFAGGETRQCKLTCGSSPYRGAVERLFPGGWTRGAELAARWTGQAPTSGAEFHFSYSGVESADEQVIPSEGDTMFHTGGAGVGMVSRVSTGQRCFLGSPGCR